MAATDSLMIAVNVGGSGGAFGSTTWTPFGDGVDAATTEANIPGKALTAFTLKQMGFRCSANNAQAGTNISRNNGANGNQTVSVSGSATGWFSDSTHSDSIAAGSTYSMQRGNTGGFGQTITVVIGTCERTGPLMQQNEYRGSASVSFSTTVSYGYAFGTIFSNSTESPAQKLTRAAGTWQGLGLQIGVGSSGAVTMKSRIGGADGNQIVSVASGTGNFRDSTHTDSLASGSLINFSQISLSATGSFRGVFSEFLGTISAHEDGCDDTTGLGGLGLSASTTYNHQFGGQLSSTNPTEANIQINLPYALTVSRLRVYIGSNTSSTATETVRKNTANGNSTVSVGSGVTGIIEDSTHSDSFVATDLLSAQMVTGSVTTLRLRSVLALFDDGSVSAAVAYTLTAVQGTYALTGKAVLLPVGRRVTSAQGSYSLAGQTVGLNKTLRMISVQGNYVLTGEAAAFKHGPTVVVPQGSYTLSGQTVGFIKHLSLTAVRGLYTLLGEDVSHISDISVIAGVGSYHITGHSVAQGHARTIKAHVGKYHVRKQKTVLRGPNKIATIWPVDTGDYVIDGQDVIFGQEKLRLTFSAFNNSDLLDWSSLGGADYLSYLHTMYVMSQDAMTWTQTPYLYVFVEDAQDASLFLSLVRDWAETGNTAEFGKELQVYRYQDGFLLSVTKNRFRGKGRVYQLQFRSETGKDFNLRGWATWQEKNKEP